VARIAHARGNSVLVDGAQGACTATVDVPRYSIATSMHSTGHKLYAARTGIGVCTANMSTLAAMAPIQWPAAELDREVFEVNASLTRAPHKFEAGPRRIVAGDWGSARRSDYVNFRGKAASAFRGGAWLTYAHDRLREINSLRILGHQGQEGRVRSSSMMIRPRSRRFGD